MQLSRLLKELQLKKQEMRVSENLPEGMCLNRINLFEQNECVGTE